MNLVLLLTVSFLEAAGPRFRKSIQKIKPALPIGQLPPGIQVERFLQPVDHFNPDDHRTFLQRFFLNYALYKDNGVVFLSLAAYTAVNVDYIASDSGMNWIVTAEHFGALCIMLEHRYFGKSNVTLDMSILNLQWLTARQALADVANFITATNEGQPAGTPSLKWILFGCSYGGSLAAWFRFKHPELAIGAVASSPVLEAKVNFKEYLAGVQKAIKNRSHRCADSIAVATAEMERRIRANESVDELERMFKY